MFIFYFFLNNIGFPMKGKLLNNVSVFDAAVATSTSCIATSPLRDIRNFTLLSAIY
jgi:hypothetical protein